MIAVERIQASIFAGVLLVGALVWVSISLLAMRQIEWYHLLIDVVAVLVSGLLLAMAIVWPKIAYRYLKWRLDQDGLEIQRGVIWRHRIAVPRARVQHADVSQGPLQRMFGIGTLTVHTAGTQNASVDLPGLTYEVAMHLRDELIAQGKELDVV